MQRDLSLCDEKQRLLQHTYTMSSQLHGSVLLLNKTPWSLSNHETTGQCKGSSSYFPPLPLLSSENAPIDSCSFAFQPVTLSVQQSARYAYDPATSQLQAFLHLTNDSTTSTLCHLSVSLHLISLNFRTQIAEIDPAPRTDIHSRNCTCNAMSGSSGCVPLLEPGQSSCISVCMVVPMEFVSLYLQVPVQMEVIVMGSGSARPQRVEDCVAKYYSFVTTLCRLKIPSKVVLLMRWDLLMNHFL